MKLSSTSRPTKPCAFLDSAAICFASFEADRALSFAKLRNFSHHAVVFDRLVNALGNRKEASPRGS
jgi:phosphoenolpyruvate synthase/pyruvate phosphate dikinase